MSSNTASRPFGVTYMIRTIFGGFGCWIVFYNALHGVNHYQWGAALLFVGVAFATGLFDIYEREMPGGLFGPMNITNISWLIVALVVPACLLIGGMAGSHTVAAVIGAVVLTFNASVLVSFRERGLPGLVATVAVLAMMLL